MVRLYKAYDGKRGMRSKPERKRPNGRSVLSWEDNIKADFKDM